MKVKKVINNNVIISENEQGSEIIVMGSGIGFKKKISEVVDRKKKKKTYVSNDQWSVNKLTQLLSSIPIEHIQVANEIISFAKVSLGKSLSDNLFLTLADHINYAIERNNNGLEIKNALLWEIKRFYNHEFLIGREALSIIKNKLGVDLPEDEAGFIALHIVNAELNMGKVSQVSEMTEIIQKILNIVKYHFGNDIDEYSINYERFITHLKFFVQRLFSNVQLETDDLSSFMFTLKEKYLNEYQCALKIDQFIKSEFGRSLQEDELIYLTIHLKRIGN